MCTLETPPSVLGGGYRILDMFGHAATGGTKASATKQEAKSRRSGLTDPRQHKLKSDTPPCWTLLQQEQSSQQVKQQQQAYLQAAWLNIWTTGPEP